MSVGVIHRPGVVSPPGCKIHHQPDVWERPAECVKPDWPHSADLKWPHRYAGGVGFRGLVSRLDDLDRRAGFAGSRPYPRWVLVALCLALPVLWFIKGLTIGDSPLESLITVLLIIGLIAVGTLGLYAVQRWLSRELGDGRDR